MFKYGVFEFPDGEIPVGLLERLVITEEFIDKAPSVETESGVVNTVFYVRAVMDQLIEKFNDSEKIDILIYNLDAIYDFAAGRGILPISPENQYSNHLPWKYREEYRKHVPEDKRSVVVPEWDG